jgi:branched-chain amino acid aminotransferase group I
MEEIVYLNGALLPRTQAWLSPFDYGFLYGYGLFETLRAYDGWVFRLEQHLSRLLSAAQGLGLDPRLSLQELEKAVYETLRANGLRQARLRLTLSGGESPGTPDLPPPGQPTVFISARNYIPYPEETYLRGFRAILCSLRRNSQSPLSRLKSCNYLESLLARREAKAAGAEEALLLNEQGFIAEGSGSNIFVVQGGELFTPDEESGILPGITRRVVLEIAESLGLKARESKVTVAQLLAAEEAFLTNSLLEIMPLTRVEGQAVGSGAPGEITRELRQAYMALVKRERAEFGGGGLRGKYRRQS